MVKYRHLIELYVPLMDLADSLHVDALFHVASRRGKCLNIISSSSSRVSSIRITILKTKQNLVVHHTYI